VSQHDSSRPPKGGRLSEMPPAEVLKAFEANAATTRILFETELGRGEVDILDGKIVDAMLGDLFGRQALLALFGVSEGNFSTTAASGEPRPAICASVDQLLADRAQRIAEWRRLSEQMPPLSSALRLSPEGEATLPKRDLSAPERKLVPLLDGRRSIADMVDQSSLDAVDAFGILLGWLRSGLIVELPAPELRRGEPFEIVRAVPRPSSPPSSSPSPPMQPAPSAPIQPAPSTPMQPVASTPTTTAQPAASAAVVTTPSVPVVSAPSSPVVPVPGAPVAPVPLGMISPGASNRRTTVIGMGIPAPEPVRPRRAEVHRTISVGTPSTPPVDPRGATISAMPSAPVVIPTPPGGLASASVAPPPVARDAIPSVPTTSDAPEAARRIVGRYEVIAPIGHGGMGTVYLCRLTSETGFRRFFALKLLRQHLLDDPLSAKRFVEEARLAGLLHHPNVVSVLDAGIDGAQPYLVMDYVEGGSLRQLVAAHPIDHPSELVVPVILDALAGLHAVHQLRSDEGIPLNIVHCDVSPENLLVGVDGICRLTDFGVARRESTVGERLAHGKPAYLAPEQVLRRPIDRRVDIFTMGIVLYNSLTGIRLFDSPSVDETLRRVVGEPIPPPSTVGLGPPPCFDFVCMKALERDPNRRYSTAEEMAAELRRIALRENLIAPTSNVANWVRMCVGKQLDQRRALTLHPPAPGEAVRMSGSINVGPPSGIPRDLLPAGESAGEPTGTVPLDLGGKTQRRVLVAAAVLAAGAVLLTLLWPAGVSRFFRINTSGARAESIDLSLDTLPSAKTVATTAPSAATSNTASGGRPSAPATLEAPAPPPPPARAE
jgi:serine/threonine protein kinase